MSNTCSLALTILSEELHQRRRCVNNIKIALMAVFLQIFPWKYNIQGKNSFYNSNGAESPLINFYSSAQSELS